MFDATGTMRATFFNQPWLVERYPPGTRLLLHGKADGARRASASPTTRSPRETDGAGELAPGEQAADRATSVAHYPAAEGVSSTQILTLVRGASGRARATCSSRCRRRARVAERLPDRASGARGDALRARAEREREPARERLAFEELLLTQLLFLRRRARRRRAAGAHARSSEPPSLSARWLARRAAVRADRRPARARSTTIDEDLAQRAADAAAADGRGGSGKTVVALYAMLRAVEHGRQAALMAPTETLAEQHFATIQRLLGGEPVAVRAADRLDAGAPARGHRSASSRAASCR